MLVGCFHATHALFLPSDVIQNTHINAHTRTHVYISGSSRRLSPMVVKYPLDTSKNVAKTVTTETMRRMQVRWLPMHLLYVYMRLYICVVGKDIYTHKCIHACMHVHICAYIHTTCIHTRIHTCTHAHTYNHTKMHKYTHTLVHTRTSRQLAYRPSTYVYVCIHACIYIQMNSYFHA